MKFQRRIYFHVNFDTIFAQMRTHKHPTENSKLMKSDRMKLNKQKS